MNDEQVEKVIRDAFGKGESWGVTYSGWFSPSKSDREAKVIEAINEIKEKHKGDG